MITNLSHTLHYQDLNQLFESCLKLVQDRSELDLESNTFLKLKEKIESETNSLISTFLYEHPEISFIKLVYQIHEIIEKRSNLIAISCISEYEIHILEVLFKNSDRQLDCALNEWYNDLMHLYENSITFESNYLLALIFNSLDQFDDYVKEQKIGSNLTLRLKHLTLLKQFSKITKSDTVLKLRIGSVNEQNDNRKLLPFGTKGQANWYCEKNDIDYYKGSILEDHFTEHYLNIPISKVQNINFVKSSLLYLINQGFLLMDSDKIDSLIEATFLSKNNCAKTRIQWSPQFKKGNLVVLFRHWLTVLGIYNKLGFCRVMVSNLNTPYSLRALYEFLIDENKIPVHDYIKQIDISEIYATSGVLKK
ncbi:MAG: hypothetical protein R8N23_05480 [Reichenbachiella sp.]|uniref:hypothetical protein n=1 Tax=Reichenbachiella sp. TaxID=2184521 RepID=UPI0029674982|nr:hypothetical protein [Reichenbachiella sp.]MDW3209295.1 hypothetical protein [Reichenbachiella sp.]